MLRLANSNDLDTCISMARMFHSESPYKNEEFSEEKITNIFNQYLEDKGLNLIIILACDEKPFGMIIGIKSELPFSTSLVCTELAWWVNPDKRGTKDSLMMFKAYEDWSRRVGGNLMAVAMLDGVTDLSEFYSRQGYRQAEKTYIKEV